MTFSFKTFKPLQVIAAVLVAANSWAGSLTGTLTESGATNVNLTAVGTTDWAIWGYGSGGTSTSLTPDNRKAGASAISDLTSINPNSVPLRGLGQFTTVNPFSFSWSDGSPTASASGSYGGIQHNDAAHGGGVNTGFSFSVPADTTTKTLTIYALNHEGIASLTATLSDGSAAPLTLVNATSAVLRPQVFTITYSANSPGQTLYLSYTMDSCTGCDGSENLAMYAAGLTSQAATTSVPTLSEWAMIGLASLVAMFGLARSRRRNG